ncbi:MAG: hypothetical protein V8S95_14160 [Odoribacter sp.]
MKKNLLFVILIIIVEALCTVVRMKLLLTNRLWFLLRLKSSVQMFLKRDPHRLTLTIRGGGGVLSPMDETGKLGGTGYYSDGEIISLIAEEESFLYWIINGEQIEGSEVKLDITLNEDMDIVAVTTNLYYNYGYWVRDGQY